MIACRSEQHAALDFVEFLSVFSETWGFVINTETIGRRMIVGLRGVIVSQVSPSETFITDRIKCSYPWFRRKLSCKISMLRTYRNLRSWLRTSSGIPRRFQRRCRQLRICWWILLFAILLSSSSATPARPRYPPMRHHPAKVARLLRTAPSHPGPSTSSSKTGSISPFQRRCRRWSF